MSATSESRILSRSGIFHRLGNLLSDVSSNYSSDSQVPFFTDQSQTTSNDLIHFDTSFASLTYRQDLVDVEHIHIRCHPASSFDPSMHTNLCEVVLGIFPDTDSSSSERPILIRGVNERRHRRIKVGDWLLAINGNRLNYTNLDEILSKYRSNRKVRLTIRHPATYISTFSSSLQPPITLPIIEEKKLSIPESIDCIHSILYYEKKANQGFKLLYQYPVQKDIFFAVGGVFPTLTQLMSDMNEHDSLLRSISIKLAEQIVPIGISSQDKIHYFIVIYPPNEHLHIHILERYTQQIVHLINFLFGSIEQGLFLFQQSIEYFFDLLFYRLNHLLPSLTSLNSNSSKNLRYIDEFFLRQFSNFGICPRLTLNNPQLLMNIDGLLNQLECQNFNECSNENDFIINRYRRIFFITGSILFHRYHLLITHLSTQLTNDIYYFLLHYGHLNFNQFPLDTWQLLLFKEIFPNGLENIQRSFLMVCSQGELTLAIVLENQYEKNELNISADHGLIQQIKLILNDIYSIFPPMITSVLPWTLSSPTRFLKKQLKRTISLPLIGGAFGQTNVAETSIDDNISYTSSHHPDLSSADIRVTQLVSQPESQDELYKSSRQSFVSSTLSLDEQQKRSPSTNLSIYRLHPGNYSTIFYYLDFQSVRSLLIAPYFTLDRLTQTSLIDRFLFETIQQTCVYIREKHFLNQKKVSLKNLYSTKPRSRYSEIGCQFSIQTDPEVKKKKDTNFFQFWIVGKKCLQPIEHEFFVCYHDSIAQNITELAFTIGLASV